VWRKVTVQHGQQFLKHVVPAIAKPIRSLWNEVIGFIFLCFALIFGFRTGHYAWSWLQPEPNADTTGHVGRMLIAGFCTALTGYFALTSFLRARKISRS
jgi:hypothetical protein